MKNIRIFYLKNCHFLVVKFSVYLNRRVFIMETNREPNGDNHDEIPELFHFHVLNKQECMCMNKM